MSKAENVPKTFSVDFVANTTKNTACQFHNAYELCFFFAGTRTYIVNEQIYDAEPYSLIIIPPYMQHSTCGTEAVTRAVVYFTKSFLLDYFSENFTQELLLKLSSPFFARTSDNEFSRLIERIKTAHSEHRKTDAALCLAQLLQMANTAEQIPAKQKSEMVQNTITRALKYIETNFSEIRNLEEIAKKLKISLSYLEASFRKSTGTSLMQFVIKTRLNHATKLLLETKKSIAEISLLCGFHSSTHFSNTFKKHMGHSPRAYRK